MPVDNKGALIFQDIRPCNAKLVSCSETSVTYSNAILASNSHDFIILRLLSRYLLWDVEPTMPTDLATSRYS